MTNKRKKSKKSLVFRCFSSRKVLRGGIFQGLKVLSVLFLIGFYMFQVTEMTKDIYNIQVYNRKINEIHEESRRAEYGFLKSNSITRAEELIEMSDYVRAENVHYISLVDFEVASR